MLKHYEDTLSKVRYVMFVHVYISSRRKERKQFAKIIIIIIIIIIINKKYKIEMPKNHSLKSHPCKKPSSRISPRRKSPSGSSSRTPPRRMKMLDTATRSCNAQRSVGARHRWSFGERWDCVRGWLFGMLFSNSFFFLPL
jgi:hypothetical protein